MTPLEVIYLITGIAIGILACALPSAWVGGKIAKLRTYEAKEAAAAKAELVKIEAEAKAKLQSAAAPVVAEVAKIPNL